MKKRKSESLTVPDLVVLSYLDKKPMHGYQLNLLLEQHDVSDWAGISRPQVYYSLNKLRRLRMIRYSDDDETYALGPEKRVFTLNENGKSALKEALTGKRWATQRPPPPFLTWLALSHHIDLKSVNALVEERRQFLLRELDRERETLLVLQAASGRDIQAARLMVGLTIKQFELELNWLGAVIEGLTSGEGGKTS